MQHLGFSKDLKELEPKEVIRKVRGTLRVMRERGQHVPEETTKLIYKTLCRSLQTAPIDIFSHVKDEELKLNNYGLNSEQTKPISYVLPFISEMKSVKMTNCNLTDEAASMVVDSVLGGSNVKSLDFKGIQMGEKFLSSFNSALENDPECLWELSMEGLKTSISMSVLIQSIQPCMNLVYLDI